MSGSQQSGFTDVSRQESGFADTPDGLGALETERVDPRYASIDRASVAELATLMNEADATVPAAVRAALPQIVPAIEAVAERMREGGRLLYVGAGTPGRLGVLDASECPPTFSTPPELVRGMIAGGEPAMFAAQEGAEDDGDAGRAAIAAEEVGAGRRGRRDRRQRAHPVRRRGDRRGARTGRAHGRRLVQRGHGALGRGGTPDGGGGRAGGAWPDRPGSRRAPRRSSCSTCSRRSRWCGWARPTATSWSTCGATNEKLRERAMRMVRTRHRRSRAQAAEALDVTGMRGEAWRSCCWSAASMRPRRAPGWPSPVGGCGTRWRRREGPRA